VKHPSIFLVRCSNNTLFFIDALPCSWLLLLVLTSISGTDTATKTWMCLYGLFFLWALDSSISYPTVEYKGPWWNMNMAANQTSWRANLSCKSLWRDTTSFATVFNYRQRHFTNVHCCTCNPTVNDLIDVCKRNTHTHAYMKHCNDNKRIRRSDDDNDDDKDQQQRVRGKTTKHIVPRTLRSFLCIPLPPLLWCLLFDF
jgi:hypothetical protein